MGAWGIDAFDNDSACDWAYGLDAVDDLSLLHETLDAALDVDNRDYDPDTSTEALAACEVIARLRGNWGKRDAYTEEVDNWVLAHPTEPDEELIRKALQAIDWVASDSSSLRELWADSSSGDKWLASVADLRQRVSTEN